MVGFKVERLRWVLLGCEGFFWVETIWVLKQKSGIWAAAGGGGGGGGGVESKNVGERAEYEGE